MREKALAVLRRGWNRLTDEGWVRGTYVYASPLGGYRHCAVGACWVELTNQSVPMPRDPAWVAIEELKRSNRIINGNRSILSDYNDRIAAGVSDILAIHDHAIARLEGES